MKVKWEYISAMDVTVEAAVEPTLPPMPLISRVVTCSGWEILNVLRVLDSQFVLIFVIKCDVQNLDFLKFQESGRSNGDPR
jgi:hypothetical protein